MNLFIKVLIFAMIIILSNNIVNGQSVRTEQIIRLENPNDHSKYLILKAPTNLITIQNFQLPATGGTDGQVLTTDGSGGLTWESPAAATMKDTVITTATTLDGNYDVYILQVTSQTSFILPLSSNFKGKTITIKAKNYSPIRTCIISPQSGDQLEYSSNGFSIYTFPTVDQKFLRGITVYSDGSRWHIISTVNY